MNDYNILNQVNSNKMYYSVRIFINKLENKENPITLSSLGNYNIMIAQVPCNSRIHNIYSILMNKNIKQFGELQSTLKKFDCIFILRYSV